MAHTAKISQIVKGTKKPQRGTAKRTLRSKGKKAGRPSASYENVGRKSLYPGKDKGRHASAYLTPDAWKKITDLQPLLLKRYGKDKGLNTISISDVLEEGVHRLHRELTRPR